MAARTVWRYNIEILRLTVKEPLSSIDLFPLVQHAWSHNLVFTQNRTRTEFSAPRTEETYIHVPIIGFLLAC